jgi:hypothetical protein
VVQELFKNIVTIASLPPLVEGVGAAPVESYQLQDLSKLRKLRRYLDKQKRGDKKFYRRIEQAEAGMKFSHSIQFNAVPDWSSHYIAYSNLKKLYVVPLGLCYLVLEKLKSWQYLHAREGRRASSSGR